MPFMCRKNSIKIDFGETTDSDSVQIRIKLIQKAPGKQFSEFNNSVRVTDPAKFNVVCSF